MMRLQTFQLPHQRRFFPQRRIFPAQQPREQIQRRRQRPSRLKAQTIVQIPAQRLTEKMPAPIRPRLIQQPENALIRPNQQMLPVVQKRKRIAGHAARPPACHTPRFIQRHIRVFHQMRSGRQPRPACANHRNFRFLHHHPIRLPRASRYLINIYFNRHRVYGFATHRLLSIAR